MSFTGDLEHLPVVDIIQLLHSSRKSGTLRLVGPNGESRLVFSDGYIVGANHRNTAIRLGQVLLGMNALTQADLDQALSAQKSSGAERQPLIATLIESGKIDKNLAYKGLESLIVMTIIDVLTWDGGTFSVDVEDVTVSDEYRYFPEKLQQDFYASTQNILMDALRIFDEKRRDGELTGHVFATESEEAGEEPASPAATPATGNHAEAPVISVDLLGLDELDRIEKKIPDVFRGLKADFVTRPGQALGAELVDIPEEDRKRIITHLQELADSPWPRKGSSSQAVIFLSHDDLFKHAITMLCKHCGYFAFTTDDDSSLDLIIEQSMAREATPIFLIDAPNEGDSRFSSNALRELRRSKLSRYPDLTIMQMVSTHDTAFAFEALRDGVAAIFPKPDRQMRENFAEQTLACLDTLRLWLERSGSALERALYARFVEALAEFEALSEPPEIAFVLLRFAAAIFKRTLTLVVVKDELVAERSLGIKGERSAGPSAPLKFRIPLGEPSVFRNVVNSGHLHWGAVEEPFFARHLAAEFPAPRQNRVLLLPLKAGDRTIAVIYGDFGDQGAGRGHIDLLALLARQGGTLLENALYRKKLSKNV